jgi:tRNA threonylcarbamoyladenosine dehydratase
MQRKFKTLKEHFLFECYKRNLGIFNSFEQNTIWKSTVAIAGVGGIGGLLAERLVRIGVGKLKITDPDSFDASNINRQYCSGIKKVGMKKVLAITKELKRINPYVKIEADKKGIWSQNDADHFIYGADVVIDAMNFGLFKESTYLQRAARNKKIYYLFASAIGFGSIITIFKPGGMTLESFNGLSQDVEVANSSKIILSLKKICPQMPPYLIKRIGLTAINKMIQLKSPVSVNSIGAGLGAILLTFETINILLGKKPSALAPKQIYIDLSMKKFQIE